MNLADINIYLELLVSGETFFLSHGSVDGDSWKVLLQKQLSQSHTSLY